MMHAAAILARSGLVPASAGAACLSDTSLPAEFGRSDAVFTGTVIAHRPLPPQDHYFDRDGDVYVVNVNEVFRGKPGASVQIFSENSSGRFPMEIGANYILFVSRKHERMLVDRCDNSGGLPTGEPTVAAVRALISRKRNR